MKTRSFTVIVYKEEDMYIAECPEVGTVDQGETIEEAVTSLKDATQLYLEEFPLPAETFPRSIAIPY
jgi:predicted RNase H-like HicB family nuclease